MYENNDDVEKTSAALASENKIPSNTTDYSQNISAEIDNMNSLIGVATIPVIISNKQKRSKSRRVGKDSSVKFVDDKNVDEDESYLFDFSDSGIDAQC